MGLRSIQNATASSSVASAMKPSDSMIRYLRWCRSAQTPPNSDTSTCGSVEQMVESIIQKPDEVSSVIYQTIAKPTTEEPNNEMFWLIKKSAAFFIHGARAGLVF